MIPRSRWLDVLIIELVVIATIYLLQLLLGLVGEFSDLILLFGLAWLVSFTLEPLITNLSGKPLSPVVVRAAHSSLGPRAGAQVEAYRISRATAVEIVYFGFALIVVALIALFVPAAVVQFTQLINQLPVLITRLPELTGWIQHQATEMGLNISVENSLQAGLTALQGITTTLLQNMLSFASRLLSIILNTLFILALSFFFALDRKRLSEAIYRVVPREYERQVHMFSQTVDRTFGGFFRAQLIQGLLMGAGTVVAMVLLGVDYGLVAGFFAGLFMVIPFIGPILTFVPPVLVALVIKPDSALILLVILVVVQFIIANFITPRLLADALGLHPLVIFAAILAGLKVAGFWGAIFGVPVAGVIAAMVIYLYRIWSEHGSLAIAEQDGTPIQPVAPPTAPEPAKNLTPDPSSQPLQQDT